MALYDIAAKQAGQPLYTFLVAHHKKIETDLTIGIELTGRNGRKSADICKQGVRIIKIKLGKNAERRY